jgi:hypothetical protein
MRFGGLSYLLTGILLCANTLALADASSEAREEFVAAHKQLQASEQAERRARAEFQDLLANDALSSLEVEEYRTYLLALQRLTETHRANVARLSQATPAPASEDPQPARSLLPPTDEERASALDAKLNASLSEFDEMLLRELEDAKNKARTTRARTAGNASDPGGQGVESAAAGGQAGESGAQDSDAQSRAGSPQEPGASPSATASDETTAAGDNDSSAAATGSGSGKREAPPDIPDGRDDDVVARQLREAAENEADPALREKLWDEYRRYKQGS